MRQNIQTTETQTQGWRLLSEANKLQVCEVCGGEDQFLMSFTAYNRKSHQLCSACYTETISSRLDLFPRRA